MSGEKIYQSGRIIKDSIPREDFASEGKRAAASATTRSFAKLERPQINWASRLFSVIIANMVKDCFQRNPIMIQHLLYHATYKNCFHILETNRQFLCFGEGLV